MQHGLSLLLTSPLHHRTPTHNHIHIMGSSQSSPAAATSSTTASEKQQAQLDAAALDKLSQTMGRACLHSSSNKSDAPAHATLTQDDLARWSAAYADNKAANVVGTLLR